MKFVLASGNAHKVQEICALMPKEFELTLQTDLGIESVPETASTFVENALLKARHATSETGLPAIADDSGLCVAALNGAPGLYSARYAGPDASSEANIDKLLSALKGVDNRHAFFYCVLVCLDNAKDPAPLIAAASWPGTIALKTAGRKGFGYDPVFRPEKLKKTAAELAPEEKNALSHRGQALSILTRKLNERYSA